MNWIHKNMDARGAASFPYVTKEETLIIFASYSNGQK